MYISDDLRIKLSKKFSINLELYVWDDELNDYLMQIKLDDYLMQNGLNPSDKPITTMDEVYKLGYNIGSCGLTSRYFAVAFPNAKLVHGILPILKGTKNSKEGTHAWIIENGYYIDPTLRIKIPEAKAIEIGYVITKELADKAARYFSENESYYKHVLYRQRNLDKYNQSLLKID